MKFQSVSYKKIFPLQQFVNETIGIECSVDEGEDPSDVLDKAKEKIESWHMASRVAEEAKARESIFDLRQNSTPNYSNAINEVGKVIFGTKEINRQDEKKEISIENASTIEELATLKKDLPTNLMPAYIKKLTDLTNEIK